MLPPKTNPITYPAEPTLTDLLTAHAQAIMLGFNCHGVAIVNSFTAQDPKTGRPKLTATMAYSKTITVQQPNGTYTTQSQDYAPLVDCPVVVLGGGSTALQLPIAPGDTCLILFNDRSLLNWWGGANSGPLANNNLHAFSDAIALVGLGKWAIGDTSHALLTNGNAKLGVPANSASAKVLIGNNSTTLYTLLAQLITAIEGITVLGVTAGAGTSGGLSPASTAALNSAKSALQALLE